MRKRKVVYNGIWAMLSYAVLFILGLANRRVFLANFDASLLGYQGIFQNIFSLLSVTEMGVGMVVSYGLYRELGHRNEAEIAKLMMIYKWMYRIIGAVVIVLGIGMMPFLINIVGGPTAANDVYAIYVIYLLGTMSTYFMSFRRLLYICDQKNYVCVIVDTSVNIAIGIFRILIAVFTSNYLLYFGMSILGSVIANLILAYMCNKSYPYAKHVPITLADIKMLNFFEDVGLYSVQRIAVAVYGGVDNIISSHVLGVLSVVHLTNYTSIEANVTGLIDKAMSGMQAAVGSVVYDEDEKKKQTFTILEQLGYFLAVFVAICYAVLFQDFIEIWLDSSYLLDWWFVAFFSLNQYVAWNHRVIVYFRSAVGHFEYDLPYSAAGALANLLLSIRLSMDFGFPGLIFATLVGHVILWLGRTRVVFHYVFQDEGYKGYWVNQVKRILLFIVEFLMTSIAVRGFSGGIKGLMLKLACCAIIPNVLNLVIFRKSDSVLLIRQHANAVLKKYWGTLR